MADTSTEKQSLVPKPLLKLVITAVDKEGNELDDGQHKPFNVMFNPDQYTLTYRNSPRKPKVLSPTPKDAEHGGQSTQDFKVKLLLDGTGAAEYDSRKTGRTENEAVQKRVAHFLKTCFEVNKEKHKPNRLHIEWGIIDFFGWLQSVQVHYTLFDQSGIPLRAELDCHFIGESIQNAVRPQDLNSPDMTHIRQVKAGDTLPLMAKAIYGSSRYYLLVAQANGLDDFRNLQPGTKLYFPPLNPTGT